ncbi:class I SAM-dependent methyltransferase [Streptomyces sp. SID7909]|uniref:class I SAM-dependent methyltransferase n=1 Tax=Streptomyces sp. SID7909 TaxID=2706092 RepID=UPI0013BB8ACF|nr:class I SAM-dependent methyltransferase [Streptomyces sp. SID7909]NEC09896.1 methyltransferase domain-containing protein [Streptomyces sp. SID7909]
MEATAADRRFAEDYRLAREIPRDGLTAWRAAVAAEVELAPGATVLDVGAGTGSFASAFADWFGVRVLAVEPAAAMRALIPRNGLIKALDGRAEALPVPDGCADAAWLGSVVHHIGDLPAAARELRRALKPGAPVLIRNSFPGRCARDLRVRFFPGAERIVDGYPTVEQTCAAFARTGFTRVALHAVPQESAPSLAAFADRIRRDTDAKLRGLGDDEFERGMHRLRTAAEQEPDRPAVSWMDLLVLA